MKSMLIYPAGSTAACRFACAELEDAGFPTIDHPSPEVTHLLLDVPSFAPDGTLRDGSSLPALLEMLPPGITVIGGNLSHPALEGYPMMDLLQDPGYLAENAAITAHCALEVAAKELPVVLARSPVLVIGWGRIGKCLARLLKALDAQVTVAARKETDQAMIRALGYRAADTARLENLLHRQRLVFNTVPHLLLPQTIPDRRCVKIDLASTPGIGGSDVIQARGLPGKLAPESSGHLIANTVYQLTMEEML